jgi:anti-sigma factor RsiW
VTCEQARALMHAYVDGELDLVRSLEVEAHLNACAACARERAGLQTLRAAISGGALYHEAPAWLERTIRSALRDERRAERGRGYAFARYGWAGAAAAAVVLVTLLVTGRLPFGSPASDLTAREVVDDHLRSLTANHLADVLSSNQHTVKPWFDGRLNFTPPVEDLGAQGFPLVGGRLDYLDGHPIAAVVYRRREHVINLFIWPARNAADTRPVSQVREGYNIAHWTKSGMTYWAVSSVNAAELGRFAELMRDEGSGPSTPTPSG